MGHKVHLSLSLSLLATFLDSLAPPLPPKSPLLPRIWRPQLVACCSLPPSLKSRSSLAAGVSICKRVRSSCCAFELRTLGMVVSQRRGKLEYCDGLELGLASLATKLHSFCYNQLALTILCSWLQLSPIQCTLLSLLDGDHDNDEDIDDESHLAANQLSPFII